MYVRLMTLGTCVAAALVGCSGAPNENFAIERVKEIVDSTEADCRVVITGSNAGEGDAQHAYYLITIMVEESEDQARSIEVLLVKDAGKNWLIGDNSHAEIISVLEDLCSANS